MDRPLILTNFVLYEYIQHSAFDSMVCHHAVSWIIQRPVKCVDIFIYFVPGDGIIWFSCFSFFFRKLFFLFIFFYAGGERVLRTLCMFCGTTIEFLKAMVSLLFRLWVCFFGHILGILFRLFLFY